jgi:hypothetical protein
MPSPVPSSVTVVRSLGTGESFHAREPAGRLAAARPPDLRRSPYSPFIVFMGGSVKVVGS